VTPAGRQRMTGKRDAVDADRIRELADGLPVGLQLVGERFDDRTLLRLGRCVERGSGGPAAG